MARIEIEDGYEIKIDGNLAGSLENAISNFPALDVKLWAGMCLELQSSKKALVAAQAQIVELQTQITELQAQIPVIVPDAPVLTEDEQIDAEVNRRIEEKAKQIAEALRAAEIERRIALIGGVPQ
jgi:Tfp pilus assembly protein FimV